MKGEKSQQSQQALCGICQEQRHKYKCPKCTVQYCGIACFKAHECDKFKNSSSKEIPQSDSTPMEAIHKSNYVEDEELRVPRAKLEMLKKSTKIKEILKSSKLRQTLLQIDNARSRLWELNNEMKTNPHFLEFTQLLLDEMGMLSEQKEFI